MLFIIETSFEIAKLPVEIVAPENKLEKSSASRSRQFSQRDLFRAFLISSSSP